LGSAEFAVNNKIHMATKALPFMVNYGREIRMGEDIRKKGKVESAMEFVERMKKVHEKAGAILKKTQEEMKRYADRSRKEMEEWKRGDRVMLSTKDLSIQRETCTQADRKICGAIHNRGSSIIECGKVTITKFDENSFGG